MSRPLRCIFRSYPITDSPELSDHRGELMIGLAGIRIRLEFAGALYHITSRGNGRNLIYLQDDDFELFIVILGDVCDRYN